MLPPSEGIKVFKVDCSKGHSEKALMICNRRVLVYKSVSLSLGIYGSVYKTKAIPLTCPRPDVVQFNLELGKKHTILIIP